VFFNNQNSPTIRYLERPEREGDYMKVISILLLGLEKELD
jgi:hypothetical protein